MSGLKVESGASLLCRLVGRSGPGACLGPGLPVPRPGPAPTRLLTRGEAADTVQIRSALTVEMVVRATTAGATVLLIDCDHHAGPDRVAGVLQTRAARQAAERDRELRAAGAGRAERVAGRLGSSEQWELVAGALGRMLYKSVFTPDGLEMALLSLPTLTAEHTNLSLVIVSGVNTFYHQVSPCGLRWGRTASQTSVHSLLQ